MEQRKNRELICQTSRNQWVLLLVVVYSSIVFTVASQSLPPLIPAIISEFSITDVQAGLIISIVLVPVLLLSLPSGWLLTKYSAKKVGIAALLCTTIASIVTAVSNSFEMMLFGRLLMGFGGVLITITGLAIISRCFKNKDLGKAMGVLGASNSIAMIITFPAMSFVMTIFNWRYPFYISSIITATAIVLFLVFIKDSPYSEKNEEKAKRTSYFSLELWKLGLICLGAQGALFSFSTWAPTLFTEFVQMPIVQASFLAGLTGLPGIFLKPFFGYLSDRMGKRRHFLILGPLLMTLAFLTLALGSNLTLTFSVLCIGIAIAITTPVVNIMPAEMLGPNKAGVGFGVISIFSSLGGVLSAPAIGFIKDATGSFAVCLFGISAFSVFAVILAFTLKTR